MSSIRIVEAYIQDSAPRFTNIQELETLISEGYELAACVYVGTETPFASNFLVYTMVKK
jgi:hypothetical protein